MHRFTRLAQTAAVALGGVALWGGLFSIQAHAIDLTGAWTTEPAVGQTQQTICNKVFAKSGNSVNFTSDSELHGSGFIIEGSKLRGKSASCTIRARKEVGDIVHLVAACSSEVMLSDAQFSLKVVNEDRVLRLFADMPELTVTYTRCRL